MANATLRAQVGRAGLGRNEHAFVLVETTGKGKQVARPLRETVTVLEQKPLGDTLQATVQVPIVQPPNIVELRIDAGKTYRFKVTSDGQIII